MLASRKKKGKRRDGEAEEELADARKELAEAQRRHEAAQVRGKGREEGRSKGTGAVWEGRGWRFTIWMTKKNEKTDVFV